MLTIGVVHTILAARAMATLNARLAELAHSWCGEGFAGEPGVARVQIVAGVSILVGAVIIALEAVGTTGSAFRSALTDQRGR